jgi:hypothetical protein
MDARQITHALRGKWYGGYGSAACPVCQPDQQKGQNALTLTNGNGGRILLHCKKSGCAFNDIRAAAGIEPGGYAVPNPSEAAQRENQRMADAAKRAAQAHCLWQKAQPINGTLAETYLRARGISCPLPETLRFLPACWHPAAKRLPAMLALVDGTMSWAVHRTYLAPSGGKAQIEPNKMMLGCVSGGAVRLVRARGPLVVAEGIETSLSLACGLLRQPVNIWAALSTSGMRGLQLPKTPDRLIIAADGEKAGRDAAQALAERANALGWEVSLLPAPDGHDWNNVLAGKVVAE